MVCAVIVHFSCPTVGYNTSYTQSVDTNPTQEIYRGIGAAVVDLFDVLTSYISFLWGPSTEKVTSHAQRFLANHSIVTKVIRGHIGRPWCDGIKSKLVEQL